MIPTQVIPYSKNIYPDFTLLNKTLQTYEFAQICILFKHENQFSIFLNRIEPLILSYPQINEVEWHRCAKRIDALFPNKTSDEASAFMAFKKNVNCEFQFTIFSPMNPKEYYRGVKRRFLPNQQKAEILQRFLNLLIVEADFFSTLGEMETMRPQCERLGVVIEKIPKNPPILLCEVTQDVLETAKPMIKPYKDIQWATIGPATFIYIESHIDIEKMKRNLNALIKKSPPESLKRTFEKLIIGIEKIKLEKKINQCSEKIKTAYENFIDLKKNLAVYSKELPKKNLGSTIAISLERTKRYLKKYYSNSLQDYPPSLLQEHILIWEKTQNNQMLLFNFLLNRLELKIKDLGKHGAPFCQDLTLKGRKSGILRPYPNLDPESMSYYTDTIKRIKSYINPPPAKTLPKKLTQRIKVIKAIVKPKRDFTDLQFAHKMISVQYNKQVTPNPVREEMRLIKAFPGKKFPYAKDTRLKIWENHPFQTPLLGDDFKDYSHLSLEEQVWQHIYHAPHPLVDRFIHLGVKGFWESEDHQIYDCRRVLAEIEFKGEVRIGCFEFNIIFDRACYHRGFNTKLEGELLELHTQKQQEKNTQANRPEYVDRYKTWVKTDTAGNAEIFDTEKNLRIKLFNAQIV